MQLVKSLFNRSIYKYFPFWSLLLLALYSAAGFLLMPNLLQTWLTEQAESNFGWRAEIGHIEINPYFLTISIDELSIYDDNNEEVFGFNRAHTDFSLRSIFELALTFRSIELLEPRINLSINSEGITNVQTALDAHYLKDSEQYMIVEPLSKVPFLFDQVIVKNGALKVIDHQPSPLIEHNINPITFTLENFSTRIDEDGEYQLDIALGTGQTLQWKGLLALNPIRSSGTINVSGIKAHKFWPYVEAYFPYELTHGIASVKAEYKASLLGEELDLTVKNGVVDIEELIFNDAAVEDGFIHAGHINVGQIDFDLQAQHTDIGHVQIDALTLNALRDSQGTLPMLPPFYAWLERIEAMSGEPEDDFTWHINKLVVADSKINWLDRQPRNNAAFEIENINLEVQDINQELSSVLAFTTNYSVNGSDTNTATGELVLEPFKLNTHLILKEVDLKVVQPYLNEYTKVNIIKGWLYLDGLLALGEQEDGELDGNFDGSINIQHFNSRDQKLNQRLVGWQEMSISPIKVNLKPLNIDINRIALKKPYFRVTVGEDREVNLSNLFVEGMATPQLQQKARSIPIRIREVSLSKGSANFADLSLRPQFSSSVQNVHGTISGLSSDNLQRADVNINGSIDEYGTMLIKGKINPLSGDLYTDINASFEKVELTTMTPYSGRYAGYVIEKGKLSLHLNYKVNNRQLDGHNRLILEQFELGESVESDEALNIPIKLGVALFKDKNGLIDIELPTTGDIDDPEFHVGGLFFQALTTVMVKAVASPFSLIANLAGEEAESLQSVAFELGKSELTEEQKLNLKTLAELLIDRPQLILEVGVMVDSNAEVSALKEQHLLEYLTEIEVDFEDLIARQQALENLYKMSEPEVTLSALKKSVEIALKEERALLEEEPLSRDEISVLKQQRYANLLYVTLVEMQPLASFELLNLAKQRISVIKRELIEVNHVPSGQVFALNPSLEGIADEDTVVSEFTLNSE